MKESGEECDCFFRDKECKETCDAYANDITITVTVTTNATTSVTPEEIENHSWSSQS